MNQLKGFDVLFLDSVNHTTTLSDDSATPRIIKNIERISNRYREYVKSEIVEDLDVQSEQAERIRKLRKKEGKTSK